MAKPVDELIVQIKADTRQLQKELDQIKGRINVVGSAGSAAFGAAGGGLVAKLKGIKGPAIAAGVAIAGIAASIVPIARIGSGFEDLKDSLDTVFGSVQAGDDAMDRIFEFAQTTPFQIETATKAFIALKSSGIEPSMDMLQTFADVASTSIDQLGAFEAMVRIVQRSAAGGMGLEEINQLDDRGIPATQILTQALGKSREELSEFGKTAEGAAEMVKILINGLQERFGGAMESKMDNLSTKTSNMTIAFKQLADEVFKSGLGEFLGDMAVRLTELANAAGALVRKVSGNQTIADITGETDVKKQREALNNLITEAKEKAEEARAAIADGFGGQVIADLRQANLDIMMLGNLLTSIGETAKVEVVDNDGLEQAIVEFMPEFKKLLEDSVPEADKLAEALDMSEQLRGLTGTDGKLLFTDEEIDRVKDHIKTLQGDLNSLAVTFDEEIKQAVVNASNAFTTDFVNSLMEGGDALQSFKDLAQNLVSQIISIFLQMGVVNEILNSVFQLKGANRFSTIREPNPSASGGSISVGQPYLVGERGPELFIPNANGTLLNNMNTKNAMGGGASVIVNQSLNFATGVVPTVRAEVTKMLPQIADVTKGAVLESAMRGGSYRRGLTGG
tara:strand:- start:3807 stop:5666 length:1860 start_codon:yes stop_codon:yes gene_type:complete